jgi:hypothetical protein
MGEGEKEIFLFPSPAGEGLGVRAKSIIFGIFSIAIHYSYLSHSL